MPGTVHQLYYDAGYHDIWVRHIVDTTFLHPWLRHPDFHLIK